MDAQKRVNAAFLIASYVVSRVLTVLAFHIIVMYCSYCFIVCICSRIGLRGMVRVLCLFILKQEDNDSVFLKTNKTH